MKKFKIGSHTADKIIQAESDSFEGLFRATLDGLVFLLIGNKLPHSKTLPISDNIIINSIDSSCLIVDFLSEILSNCYIKKAIFNHIEFLSLTDTNLSANISGHYIERFQEDIKAITYFGADLKILNGIYSINILVDI